MHAFPAPVLRMDSQAMPFHYLPVPPDVADALVEAGTRRVIVHVGGVSVRRYLFRTADGQDAVIIGRSILRDMGVEPGGVAMVDMETDPEPDRIDLCEEFQAALDQDEDARDRFDSMTPGQQRSLAYHVGSAKREDTRIRRALDTCHKLRTRTLYGDRDR